MHRRNLKISNYLYTFYRDLKHCQTANFADSKKHLIVNSLIEKMMVTHRIISKIPQHFANCISKVNRVLKLDKYWVHSYIPFIKSTIVYSLCSFVLHKDQIPFIH